MYVDKEVAVSYINVHVHVHLHVHVTVVGLSAAVCFAAHNKQILRGPITLDTHPIQGGEYSDTSQFVSAVN